MSSFSVFGCLKFRFLGEGEKAVNDCFLCSFVGGALVKSSLLRTVIVTVFCIFYFSSSSGSVT